MSFATFGDLKNRILADTGRAGDSVFIAEIPGFVRLAEQRIFHGAPNERIRVRDMELTENVTVTAGDGPLPSRFLEPIAAIWSQGTTSTEPLFSAPREIHLRRVADGSSGPARLYTIEGNQVRVWPAQSGTLVMTYSRAYAPLIAEADTNWVLQNAPSVYLHAIMIEVFRFLRDPEKFVASNTDYLKAVAGLRSSDSRSRFTATSVRRASAFA